METTTWPPSTSGTDITRSHPGAADRARAVRGNVTAG
jgi:hypothetical protein